MRIISVLASIILFASLQVACEGVSDDPSGAGDAGQDNGTDGGGDEYGDAGPGGDQALEDGAVSDFVCFDQETGEVSEGWCHIDNVCVEEGEASPETACLICNPAASPSGWTGAPEETLCTTVWDNDEELTGICEEGVCIPDHLVDCQCRVESPCCDGCDPVNVGEGCIDEHLDCAAGVCTEGGVCQITVEDGWCLIGEGTVVDPARCVETDNHLENCGECGNVCPEGTVCVVGECVVLVEEVTLEPDTLSLLIGDQAPLVATVLPHDATNQDLLWESLDEGVATVDSDGLVTGVDVGTTTVRVTTVDGAFTADCLVTVDIYIWGRPITSTAAAYIRDSALDPEGNSFVAGFFGIQAQFDDHTIVTNPNQGVGDTYLAKYDPEGNVLWVKSFGGMTSNDPFTVVSDSQGNGIMGGMINDGTLNLDGIVVSGKTHGDTYIAKFSPSGQTLWAKGHSGGHSVDRIVVDGDDNVYMFGHYRYADVDFGGGPLPGNLGGGNYLVKYDPDGNHIWSKGITSIMGFVNPTCVVVDANGDVILGGTFRNELKVEAEGPLFENPMGGDKVAIYLIKYTGEGERVWVRIFGANYALFSAMALDSQGNIHMIGSYDETINWGDGALMEGGEKVPFLVKLNGDGEHIWSREFPGNMYAYFVDLGVDHKGDLFLAGDMSVNLDLGGEPVHNPDNGVGGFLSKFTKDGDLVWLDSLLPVKKQGMTQSVHMASISVTGDGQVVFSGNFTHQISFGEITLNTPLWGAFVGKFQR